MVSAEERDEAERCTLGLKAAFGHRTGVRANIAVPILCAASGQDTKKKAHYCAGRRVEEMK